MPTPTRRVAPVLAAAGLAVVLVASAGLGYWQASQPPTIPTPPPPPGGYPELLLGAAGALEADLAVGGAGVGFVVVQRQTLRHRDGAPLLYDGVEAGASPTPVEQLYVARNISRGWARGDAFVTEIRGGYGPDSPEDFDAGVSEYAVIIDGLATWRDNGEGWFATSRALVPGLGMDPFTLHRLPTLLRRLAGVQEVATTTVDGLEVTRFAGLADSADWPGIVASDGLTFTSSPLYVEAWIGPDGRLVRLLGEAENLNERTQRLVIEVEITFGSAVPTTVPEPSPRRPEAGR